MYRRITRVPPFPAKVGLFHRQQMLFQSTSRAALHRFLAAWLPTLPASSVRWKLDIDPSEI